MITNEQIDLDELEKACRCLKEYFIKTGNLERKPVEIFVALVKKSMEYIEGGLKSSDLFFDANDICEESFNPKSDYSAAKEFITRHRKGFDKLVSENIDDITHYCSLNDVKFLPSIENTDSQGGHKTYFYLKLIPLSKALKHEVVIKSQINQKEEPIYIEYKVPQLPASPTWLKPLLNIDISGWKFYLFVILPILPIVIGYFLLIWNVYGISALSVNLTIVFITVFCLLYSFLMPFYEAMDKRVSIAPSWLMNRGIYNAQIRAIKRPKKSEKDKQFRILQFVCYKATCPICQNEVDIKQGKYQLKGRLVGVCNESPREHIFSFDHVKKQGKLLIN